MPTTPLASPERATTVLDVLAPALHGWGLLYLVVGVWLLLAGIAACLIGRGVHLADQQPTYPPPVPAPAPRPGPDTQPMPVVVDDEFPWEFLFVDRPTVPLSRREMDEFDALMGGAR